jgi:hypothetical protein
VGIKLEQDLARPAICSPSPGWATASGREYPGAPGPATPIFETAPRVIVRCGRRRAAVQTCGRWLRPGLRDLARGGYLLGSYVLLYVAAQDPDRSAASPVVDGYLSNGVVTGVVVAYIAGQVVGFVLLGIALVRSRAVPRWAGVAVAVWPVLEVAGEGSGVRAVAAVGFGLLAVGFGACAAAWLSSRTDATGDAGAGLRSGESAPVTR